MNDAITMRPETNQQTGTGSAERKCSGHGIAACDVIPYLSGRRIPAISGKPNFIFSLSDGLMLNQCDLLPEFQLICS